MQLRLYDTLTKEKRPFTPLDPSNVRMYVCGPTVYDFAHIGNARPVIVFDVLFRLLRHSTAKITSPTSATSPTSTTRSTTAPRGISGPAAQRGDPQGHGADGKAVHEDVDALSACGRRSSRAPPSTSPRCARSSRSSCGRLRLVAEDHVLFSPQAMNAAIRCCRAMARWPTAHWTR